MPSQREEILTRLAEIVEGLPSISKVYRNRAAAITDLPGLRVAVVFDGDEEADEMDPRQRPSRAPRRVRLSPEVALRVSDSDTGEVGPAMSEMLDAIHDAVLADAQLAALYGANGTVRYDGCRTDLGMGREAMGQMIVDFSIYFMRSA